MEQTRTSKQSLLQRAAKLVGDDQLAEHLGVPKHLLHAWIRGDVTMPDGKLLALSAILDKLASAKK